MRKDFAEAQSWGNVYNHLWHQKWLKAQPWLHPVCCQVLLSCPFVCSYEVHTCEMQNIQASPGRLLLTRSSTNSVFKAGLVILVFLGPYPSALEHLWEWKSCLILKYSVYVECKICFISCENSFQKCNFKFQCVLRHILIWKLQSYFILICYFLETSNALHFTKNMYYWS